jgi:hypothetical protein
VSLLELNFEKILRLMLTIKEAKCCCLITKIYIKAHYSVNAMIRGDQVKTFPQWLQLIELLHQTFLCGFTRKFQIEKMKKLLINQTVLSKMEN